MICRELNEPEVCPAAGRTLAMQKSGAVLTKSQFSWNPCGVKCLSFGGKNEIKLLKRTSYLK
jgi:hypothetical protein